MLKNEENVLCVVLENMWVMLDVLLVRVNVTIYIAIIADIGFHLMPTMDMKFRSG